MSFVFNDKNISEQKSSTNIFDQYHESTLTKNEGANKPSRMNMRIIQKTKR